MIVLWQNVCGNDQDENFFEIKALLLKHHMDYESRISSMIKEV